MQKKKIFEKMILLVICLILTIPSTPLSATAGEQTRVNTPWVSSPLAAEMERFPEPSVEETNTLEQMAFKAERPPINDVFTVQEEVY